MTVWIVRHRVAVPLGLGLASGALMGPMALGTAIPGYVVGRAGAGRGLAIVGLFVGFVCSGVWLVTSMVAQGCPSCIDALIVLPWIFPIMLGPFAVGYWLGRRSRISAARRGLAA